MVNDTNSQALGGVLHDYYAPINVFPQRGVAEKPWVLDSQSSHYPQESDRHLWHMSGTFDVSARKSRSNYIKI